MKTSHHDRLAGQRQVDQSRLTRAALGENFRKRQIDFRLKQFLRQINEQATEKVDSNPANPTGSVEPETGGIESIETESAT